MEELDLKELLQMFWEKRMQIILIVAIFFTIGIIYTVGFVQPKYESSTTLLLATNSSGDNTGTGTESITTTDVTLNSKLVSTYSELVKSKKVIRNVISNLAINEEEESIRKNVSVTAKSDTEVIEITVKNSDPVLAAKIANEIAKVFIENITGYYGIENVHIVDEAETEEQPCNINHTKDIAVFSFVGIVIAAMYVLIINMLDTTIKSLEDIEKIQGVKVLASIPIYEVEDKTKNKRKRRRK
jgi:capsular polysaccharide biosynthesis protein